jgi:hypothetical protein
MLMQTLLRGYKALPFTTNVTGNKFKSIYLLTSLVSATRPYHLIPPEESRTSYRIPCTVRKLLCQEWILLIRRD